MGDWPVSWELGVGGEIAEDCGGQLESELDGLVVEDGGEF